MADCRSSDIAVKKIVDAAVADAEHNPGLLHMLRICGKDLGAGGFMILVRPDGNMYPLWDTDAKLRAHYSGIDDMLDSRQPGEIVAIFTSPYPTHPHEAYYFPTKIVLNQ